MDFNRSVLLEVLNYKDLKMGTLYKIKSFDKHSIEFEESTDNDQQNFYFYSAPRPNMFCLFLGGVTPVVSNIYKEIAEFQEKTKLIITYVL